MPMNKALSVYLRNNISYSLPCSALLVNPICPINNIPKLAILVSKIVFVYGINLLYIDSNVFYSELLIGTISITSIVELIVK